MATRTRLPNTTRPLTRTEWRALGAQGCIVTAEAWSTSAGAPCYALCLYTLRGGEAWTQTDGRQWPVHRWVALDCLALLAQGLGYADGEAYLVACAQDPGSVQARIAEKGRV